MISVGCTVHSSYCFVFFFKDTATTEIYTLSLHDALPIYGDAVPAEAGARVEGHEAEGLGARRLDDLPHVQVHAVAEQDRKSTRLNSSHANISYAVFCLKKKHHTIQTLTT